MLPAQQQTTLDPKLFLRHWKTLQATWEKNHSSWKTDAIAFILTANIPCSKTTALQYWLFGYEFTDTFLIALKNRIYMVTSATKEKFFSILGQAVASEVEFVITKRDKKGAVGGVSGDLEAFRRILDEMRKASVESIGVIGNYETPVDSQFLNDWRMALSESGLHTVNISSQISEILAVKDPNEQKCMKTAASISVAVLRSSLLQKIEDAIDEEASVSHLKIAEDTEQLFEHPEKISPKLNPMVVESSYTPIIQSGGEFNLDYFAKNSDKNLDFSSTFLCSLGARYKAYYSDLARTYFIEPSTDQKDVYMVLHTVQETIVKELKPNVRLRDVWRKGMEVLMKMNPKLKENFLPSCGNGIGLEFIDHEYVISEDCDKIVSASMVFNVRVGFKNLRRASNNKNGKSDVYAMLLSDIVLVQANGNELLTAKCTKKFSDVSYSLRDNEKEEEKVQKAAPKAAAVKAKPGTSSKPPPPAAPSGRQTRSGSQYKTEEIVLNSGFSLRKNEKLSVINVGQRTLRSTANRKMKYDKNSTADVKRNEHQKLLEKQLIQKAKSLLNRKNDEEDEGNVKKEYISYTSAREFPPEAKRDMIYVDVNRESVLFPMYGTHVPFHITMIKNISKNEDYIRVIFKHPGSGGTAPPAGEVTDPSATYVKELAYRVTNENSLNNTFRLVNELKKRVSSRETEIRTKSSLKEQPPLILSKVSQKVPRLSHLSIRPIGRKTLGTLEAHTNGFRYSTAKSTFKIDIIYDNIKHAFFQTAENSLIVALHFHLHNEIMIAKKKCKDIQCYMEVMEASTALSQPKRGRYGDAEEIEEEQREREMRNKLNREFHNFISKVQEMIPTMEFDIPYRDLGFNGVYLRNNVFLTPTVRCLINVTEYPFFVMSLDDVQIAYFERVQFSLKSFDLVFIFNDWNKKEIHINSIAMECLDPIKNWLDSCNIKFYQGPTNMNWRNLIDLAASRPAKFWNDGGWSVLDHTNESGDEKEAENESGGEKEPDDYRPSGSEDSADYEMSSADEPPTPTREEDNAEKEEEGLDWDQLHAKAERQDMMKKGFDDEDEKQPTPKRRRK